MFERKVEADEPKFEDFPRILGAIYEIVRKMPIPEDFAENVLPGPDSWFDLNGFCDYHPSHPAKPTVYAWVSSGLVPVHKRGKKLYFLKSEVDQWLKEGRRKTRAERERSASSLMANKKGG